MKKFDSTMCVKLFIFALLQQIESYTDISLELNNNEKLQKELRMDSISRKLRDLNPVLCDDIFQQLVQQIHRELGHRKANEALTRIHLIDSSTISVCLTHYRWAVIRSTKAGIKLHTRVYDPDEDQVSPEHLVLKPAKPADKTQMDELILREPNALNFFNRAYVDYKKFDQYCEEGTRFVTRLKSNAVFTVLEERPVYSDSPITREAIVLLGDQATYQMRRPVRLIETLDQKGDRIIIITNDMNLSVEEISDVYCYRWQIEIFFKWCKQHLHIKRFYSQS